MSAFVLISESSGSDIRTALPATPAPAGVLLFLDLLASALATPQLSV